jgi:hypothetical protein
MEILEIQSNLCTTTILEAPKYIVAVVDILVVVQR